MPFDGEREVEMTYQEFKEAVIRAAGDRGVTEYELYYTESGSTVVEIFQEEVKGYSTDSAKGICFRCVVQGHAGYAATENFTGEEAVSLVERARANALSMEGNEEAYLYGTGDHYEKLAVCQEEQPSGTKLTETALALQKKLYQADSRVADGTQSYLAAGEERYDIYNSNGLDLEDKITFTQCVAVPLVRDGDEMYNGMEDWMGSFRELNLDHIASEAVEDAVSTIGAQGVESGKYSVVFSGRAMAQLLRTFSDVFSAEEVQKGRSLLKDREGEKIASDCITLVDDPRYQGSAVQRTFDGEGVAAYKKNVVEKGVLKTLLHNLSTAGKAGVKSTGNASRPSYSSVVSVSPFTFYIHPGEATKEELFSKAGNGIYVTNLEGLHAGANPVTGDFSLAASGFLLKNGRKTKPVKGFTVADNFFTLLQKITDVDGELKMLNGSFGSPSVLAGDITVGGK